MSGNVSRRTALLAAAAAPVLSVPALAHVAGADPIPDPHALLAEYRAVCEECALAEANEISDPEGKTTLRRWELEHRMADLPGLSLPALALRVTGMFSGIRQPDFGLRDENTSDDVLALRDLRDELCAAAGLPVVDAEAITMEGFNRRKRAQA